MQMDSTMWGRMESQSRKNLGLAEQFLQGTWLPFPAGLDALTTVVSSLIHCILGSLCSNSMGFITIATALLHSRTFSSEVNKVTVPRFQVKKHRLGGLRDFFQGQKHGALIKTAGLFDANAHPRHYSVHYRSFCKSSHSDWDFSAVISYITRTDTLSAQNEGVSIISGVLTDAINLLPVED